MTQRDLTTLEGKYGLEVGTPGIKSVGPLAFGPDEILFVGDNVGAAIFAIDVADTGTGNGHEIHYQETRFGPDIV